MNLTATVASTHRMSSRLAGWRHAASLPTQDLPVYSDKQPLSASLHSKAIPSGIQTPDGLQQKRARVHRISKFEAELPGKLSREELRLIPALNLLRASPRNLLFHSQRSQRSVARGSYIPRRPNVDITSIARMLVIILISTRPIGPVVQQHCQHQQLSNST